ncbi:hypothetical protein SAICODRAFT_25416 [Saitoella complicata NRRL Y-17804]|uniref:uncharacterized protein n=1 Tax=Saitoella complicata (strain BCRC 22490 / CBS 7301 / JCM 7358 / NBRC 10748 / NRRL Y-17804) TaxID=698492 RepID=UPI000867ECC6|nr:uncharacterized protein SAICODRAFT_25416 [Saitoella complicata NRRL Y-17804]ODQ52884.1 hypothetical protein SAICODRAFT_25416 [Saitoella complicata NRRL Y-17804]
MFRTFICIRCSARLAARCAQNATRTVIVSGAPLLQRRTLGLSGKADNLARKALKNFERPRQENYSRDPWIYQLDVMCSELGKESSLDLLSKVYEAFVKFKEHHKEPPPDLHLPGLLECLHDAGLHEEAADVFSYWHGSMGSIPYYDSLFHSCLTPGRLLAAEMALNSLDRMGAMTKDMASSMDWKHAKLASMYLYMGDIANATRRFKLFFQRDLKHSQEDDTNEQRGIKDNPTYLYNMMLESAVRISDLRPAEALLTTMRASDVSPNRYTYLLFINAYLRETRIGDALRMLREMLDMGYPGRKITKRCRSVILDLLHKHIKENGREGSREVLRSIAQIFNTEPLEAFKVDLTGLGFTPDKVLEMDIKIMSLTINAMVEAKAPARDLWRVWCRYAKLAFAASSNAALKENFGSVFMNNHIPNIILKRFAGVDWYQKLAVRILLSMLRSDIPEMRPDVVTFNTFFQGLRGDIRNIERTWVLMIKAGITPNILTYAAVIQAYDRNKDSTGLSSIAPIIKLQNDIIETGVRFDIKTHGLLRHSVSAMIYQELKRKGFHWERNARVLQGLWKNIVSLVVKPVIRQRHQKDKMKFITKMVGNQIVFEEDYKEAFAVASEEGKPLGEERQLAPTTIALAPLPVVKDDATTKAWTSDETLAKGHPVEVAFAQIWRVLDLWSRPDGHRNRTPAGHHLRKVQAALHHIIAHVGQQITYSEWVIEKNLRGELDMRSCRPDLNRFQPRRARYGRTDPWQDSSPGGAQATDNHAHASPQHVKPEPLNPVVPPSDPLERPWSRWKATDEGRNAAPVLPEPRRCTADVKSVPKVPFIRHRDELDDWDFEEEELEERKPGDRELQNRREESELDDWDLIERVLEERDKNGMTSDPKDVKSDPKGSSLGSQLLRRSRPY